MLDFLDSVFLSIKYSVKDIIVLPGKNLSGTLRMSLLVSVISTVCHFLKLPTLLDWRGDWLACILLFVITLIGRREKK